MLCALWSCRWIRGCLHTQVITISNPTHNIDYPYNLYVFTFTFRFPTDVPRRLQWEEFVMNNGYVVNLNSNLCSRHFVNGVDYAAGDVRRRLLAPTAVPSLVSIFEVCLRS